MTQLQPNELTDRFVGVKMAPSLYAALAELAEQRGVTPSALIRDAIREQLPQLPQNAQAAQ